MSQPTIAASREIWPDARITVLGKDHNRDLLQCDPNIDHFYVCNADPFSLRNSAEISDLKKWLIDGDFDASIILLGDQFAHLLARAGIPIRIGVKGTILETCLTDTYDIGSPRQWGANERLNGLRSLGFDVPFRFPRLYVDKNTKESALQKLFAIGLRRNEEYFVLHPFGSTLRQWFSIEKAGQLVSKINGLLGTRTILIGGPETAAIPFGADCFDTRGKLTIPELLAIIESAKSIITTDSGPFHIAGALDRPVVGLFRSRRPEHADAYPTSRVIFGFDTKCQDVCSWDACSQTECAQMVQIDIDQIWKALLCESWNSPM